MRKIRAFIGVEFDDDTKKAIAELQNQLKPYASQGRWKFVDNLHLTLNFLAEVSPEQQEKIDELLRNICLSHQPFQLSLTDPGIFAGQHSVRVLWLGLAGDTKALQALQREIEKALVPVGFSAEKRGFSPHITLGQDLVLKTGFDQVKAKVSPVLVRPFWVDRLFLFKSEQIQNRRIYTKVSEYRFSLH